MVVTPPAARAVRPALTCCREMLWTSATAKATRWPVARFMPTMLSPTTCGAAISISAPNARVRRTGLVESAAAAGTALEEGPGCTCQVWHAATRSEEHTSELLSRRDLVCRLLLEKKKKKTNKSRQE